MSDYNDFDADGDEFTGWYSQDRLREMSAPQPSPNNSFDAKPIAPYWMAEEAVDEIPPLTYVWTSRSQPRDLETGEIAFDISFNVGTKDESWSRAPITTLMDLVDNTFEYQEVADSINDWLSVAKKYPHVRRNCICCYNRATKSKILCETCVPKYGPTVDAV